MFAKMVPVKFHKMMSMSCRADNTFLLKQKWNFLTWYKMLSNRHLV